MEITALLGIVLAFAGAGLFVFGGLAEDVVDEEDDPESYLRSLQYSEEETDEFQQLLAEPFLGRVLRPLGSQVLGSIAAVLPGNYRDRVHSQLVHAGISGRYRAEEIITAQVLASVALFVVALLVSAGAGLSSRMSLLLLLFLPFAGAALPKAWLNRAVEERQTSIRNDLPDTLDLLAISVEAGVGFEGALGIVCEHFTSPLAVEFSRTLREMELGLPRREALQNLKKRTEVPELSNFVLILTQADALGMPIGRVLKTQADEMRLKRRQWAREKAAKLPVKILFPLVLFIFPAVLIVVLGPAAAEIGEAFS